MERENTDDRIWGYFRSGDVVRYDEVWGKRLFEVVGFMGNAYCPVLVVYERGKPQSVATMSNFPARYTRLVTSGVRPLRRLGDEALKRLAGKSIEAKREFIMRKNEMI